MKITDYPSVDSLTDGDVILIDGNNGTKKLLVGGDISKMTSSLNSSDNASETGIISSLGGETAMPAITSGDTHGGLFSVLSKAVLNTRKLINTVKSLWSMVGKQWVTGESVKVGCYRFYNGERYRCIRAHTTSTSILPTNTTYWTKQTVNEDLYSLNTNYNKCMLHLDYSKAKSLSSYQQINSFTMTGNGMLYYSAYAAGGSDASAYINNMHLLTASAPSNGGWIAFSVPVRAGDVVTCGTNLTNVKFIPEV